VRRKSREHFTIEETLHFRRAFFFSTIFGASVRRAIRDFLENQTGFEVCGEAVNGADAIRELKPDLILLDLAMPEMNGAEAASVLKRMMPQVPIILLTKATRSASPWLQQLVST
jgi:chemotaxis response regulator CheB